MTMDNLTKKVDEAVDTEEVLQVVKDLIATPSYTSLEERETLIAQHLLELFEAEGIDAYLQEVKDGRSTIIATFKGEENGTSLMCNGHIDTVNPFGMEDPFHPVVKDGKLYGRGSTDMKAGVGTMAYALIVLKRLGVKLKGDLVFAGVIDEESSRSAGTYHIVEHGPKTDVAIVGEPTNLHPVVAHKGCNYYEITFTGLSVHSSVPEKGSNAISAAADFIRLVNDELAEKYKQKEHPFVTPPTVTMNLIQGGSPGNMAFLTNPEDSAISGTVADTCKVYLDVRWTPW